MAAAAAAALVIVATAFAPPAARAASPFPWRGVVEGQYGTPWDHGMRTRLLGFMADHGFNAYIHAPKEDPYGRTQWRDPYPVPEQAQYDQEIAFAARHGIQWIPDLSPAVPEIPSPALPGSAPSAPICFSCPSDLQVLVDKLEPFLAAGSHTAMISFDDTQKVLTYPQDVAAYGSGDQGYGRANADLLDRLLAALRARHPGVKLLTVGSDYSGTADTAYLQGFRAHLDPAIEVFWTGTAVGSRNFTPAEVNAYARAIGRQPLVWDNWTVDDDDGNIFSATRRIHLGSYPRRTDIVPYVRGFFLNPMNEADLNELPFVTAGDYFSDPFHYDAARSYLRATAELGGEVADTLRAFGAVNFSDPFDPAREAPTFVARSDALLSAYQAGGGWPVPRASVDAELELVRDAGTVLARHPSLSYFVAQAAPFLVAAHTASVTGLDASALLAAERPSLAVSPAPGAGWTGQARPPDPARASAERSSLAGDDAAMQSDPHETYGYRVFVFDVPPYPAPPNKMDAFVQAVRALDQAWLPHAQQAATGVHVTLNGRPVALDSAGRFSLPAATSGVLQATDNAGGRTDATLPPPRVPAAGGTGTAGAPRRCGRSRPRRRRARARRRGRRARAPHAAGRGRARRRRRRAVTRCRPGRTKRGVRSLSRRGRAHRRRALRRSV